ncbi:MAG TPA: FAD-dependent oxidoreductase [Puia sp.]|nr:FAD-dependent oxidoreductase [Puia sp.]
MTHLSVWEKESFYAPADIMIIGSGLVGLWSAWYLKRSQPSLSITIVERGIIPTGASTRNAGFACFGSLTELLADSQKMGEDKMLGLVEMRYKGLKKIRKVFSKKEIGYEEHGGYELIEDGSDMNRLRSDIDLLNRKLKKIVKLQKPFRLQDDKIAGFGFAGVRHLIENEAEAQLHSGKLCQALLKLVQGMGVTVLNNIEVKNFERTNGRLLLQTDQGFNLSASQLLVCTNAFAKQLLPELDIVPARGQVLVTSPIEGLPFKGTFHFEEGFYYFRNLGDRVLLGGARNKALEEENTAEMDITGTIQQELERFLQETILPGRTYTIDHRWSGIMGMGSEKMPIVKQVGDQIFCAVRMSGMGVALAPVIGEHIASLMLGASTASISPAR